MEASSLLETTFYQVWYDLEAAESENLLCFVWNKLSH